MLSEWVRNLRKILLTRHTWRHVWLSALIVGVFVAAGWIRPPELLFETALVLHLLGLVLSLGAVLVIDWTGLAWIAGLRQVREVLRTAEAATPLVWMGLVLLLASGLFLEPDLSTPLPWVKMGAILVLANNGLVVGQVEQRLLQLPREVRREDVPASLRWRVNGSIVASHLGWWLAVAVGVVTMVQRR
ncbi:hypothetical protein [Ornithinimicrobium tianjinense]|uniref:Uncharacterized protein n=1 Tax=Ornithinimicrobium tianjinense TaxID=1195761 RepID=A0A917BHA1_9MICO|nr:hypothetical protein [Ornithinimicrobium tianjinense]GGF44414.1 hypothetical protein GCM10011366_10170 [Ornithinimicrobium tianjinense]